MWWIILCVLGYGLVSFPLFAIVSGLLVRFKCWTRFDVDCELPPAPIALPITVAFVVPYFVLRNSSNWLFRVVSGQEPGKKP